MLACHNPHLALQGQCLTSISATTPAQRGLFVTGHRNAPLFAGRWPTWVKGRAACGAPEIIEQCP